MILAPRELQHWIDGLPLANPPRSAQMLQRQLRLLVRDPQPGPRLDALLQIYHAPVRQLREVVNERLQGHLDSAVPLDQLEYSLLDLLTELAFGHLRTANEVLATGKLPGAGTLYQAMDLLDQALNIERLHYYRLVEEDWRLLLDIYLRAESQRIADQAVDHRLHGDGEPANIRGLFFRALVVSLCDPHHQRPDQVLAWHRWTGAHADLLELTILPQGSFAIPVDVSGELAPLAAARRGRPGPEMRYLATDPFLQLLQDDPQAPRDLYRALNDLLKGRKSPEQRQSPRQPRNHPFRMYYGLRNIHTRLDGLIRGEAGNPTALEPVPCRQIDQSKNGSAFRLQGPLIPPLGVGEPLLFESATASPGGAAVGFVGRIRRLVSGDDRQIEIGVEKLAGRVVPLQITGSAAQRMRGETLALLLQDMESGLQTLVAPRFLFREGDSVAAESAHAQHQLRMQQLIEGVQRIAYIRVEDSGG